MSASPNTTLTLYIRQGLEKPGARRPPWRYYPDIKPSRIWSRVRLSTSFQKILRCPIVPIFKFSIRRGNIRGYHMGSETQQIEEL